jgi:RNA polymerase sigma-70 factor (ECF subfamily)
MMRRKPMRVADEVRALWESGREAWPEIAVDLAAFAQHIQASAARSKLPMRSGGEGLNGPDLYLAVGCLQGLPAAVDVFLSTYLDRLHVLLQRVEQRREVISELRQALLAKLLAPADGSEPKLKDYSGRGPLSAWIRMVAVRMAIDLRREGARDVEYTSGALSRVVADAPDPELQYLKGRYASEFRLAFRDALQSLPSERRTLLRLHYAEGLTMDALAGLFRLSRASAHRRLAAARESLLADTCRLLKERSRMATKEIESMIRALQSQLDISIVRLLQEDPDGEST